LLPIARFHLILIKLQRQTGVVNISQAYYWVTLMRLGKKHGGVFGQIMQAQLFLFSSLITWATFSGCMSIRNNCWRKVKSQELARLSSPPPGKEDNLKNW
jgi:hypothetical protein